MKTFGNYEISGKLLMVIAFVVAITAIFSDISNRTDVKIKAMQQEVVSLNEQLKLIQEQKQKKYIRDIGTIAMYVNFLSTKKLDRDYVNKISTAFRNASIRFDIDPRVLVSIAWQESRFIATRTSPVGAVGIMQVMPLWVNDKGIVREVGLNTASDLYEPIMGIYAGAYIYDHYRTQWIAYGFEGEDLTKIVLLSYNRGKTTVLNRLRNRIDPENGYSISVRSKRNKLVKLDELVS